MNDGKDNAEKNQRKNNRTQHKLFQIKKLIKDTIKQNTPKLSSLGQDA